MASFKDYLCYDPTSPSGLRVIKPYGASHTKAGDVGGTLLVSGYWRIRLARRRFQTHRVVWEMHFGPIPGGMEVDHINGIRSDNRVENLRLADRAQNQHNKRTYRNSTTGVKGLTWLANRSIWVGRVSFRKERHRIESESRAFVINWLRQTRERLHEDFHKHG